MDALQGTADNDTFNGVLQGTAGAGGAAGTTIAPGDSINGGAGTDSLVISVAGTSGNYTLSAVQTESVERVLLNNFDTVNNDVITVATDLMNGLTTVGLQASSASGDTAFTGMRALVGAEMRNGSGDLTLTYDSAAVAGTADTQALTVSNLSGGTFTANGAETIAITSELVKSKITNVSSDKLKTVTATGAADLEITGLVAATTVDASTMTGALKVKLGTADQKVTGGSGNDVIDANTVLTKDDTIVGGDGIDTLKISAAAEVKVGTSDSKGALFNVSGIEIIDVASTNNNATLNLDGTTGVTNVVAAANVKTIQLDDADGVIGAAGNDVSYILNGVTYTVTAAFVDVDSEDVVAGLITHINANTNTSGISAAATADKDTIVLTSTSGEAIEFSGLVDITANPNTAIALDVNAYTNVAFTNLTTQSVDILSAANVTASLKDASGSDDVLNVNLKTVSADKGFNHAIGTITTSNIETINLSATGMTDGKVKTVGQLNANAMKTLNITGDSDLTISSFTGSVAAATIDGSTSTGDLNLTIADLDANLPDARTIKTGAGNDTIVMGTLLTKDVTIDGGANSVIAGDTKTGKDLVTATGNIGTVVAPAVLKIANVENIEVAIGTTAATYIDAAGITGAENIAFSATGAGTVKITNLAAATEIGVGIGANEFAGTIDVALADATGTADTVKLNYADTLDAATTVVVKTAADIETVSISASKTTNATGDNLTITATDMAAANVVVTDGTAAGTLNLGTLNKATTNVNASAYLGAVTLTTAAAGAVTVSANGKVANNITTGAGADTITLAGEIAAIAHTINGGTGKNTLNATLGTAAADFTNVSNFETINLTLGGNKQATVGNAAGLNAAKVINITGGDSLTSFTMATVTDAEKTIDASTFGGTIDLTLAVNALDADMVIKGGASTKDKVTTSVNAAAIEVLKSMTGVETLVVNTENSGNAGSGVDLVNVTGLSKLEVGFTNNANAEVITVNNLATGVAVKATGTNAADNLVISMTDKSAADNVLGLELAGTTSLNVDAAGVETINIKASANTTVDLAGVTATETEGKVSVNVTGSSTLTLKALNSQTDVVNASAATGAITLESGDRAATAMTITGGTGDDTISMRNAGDVLNGGLGTDTLKVNANFILGGIQVDLSSTTDQVTTFNGSANAAAQIGFENVDLSGVTGAFGADITAAATGSTITGTANADIIRGGAGADIITGGAGADVLTGGAGADTFVFTASTESSATVTDTITDFVGGTDEIKFKAAANFEVITDNGTIGGAANLGAAVAAAYVLVTNANKATEIDAFQFIYGGATYFAVEDAVNGGATDALVINVTGVSGTVVAADFIA